DHAAQVQGEAARMADIFISYTSSDCDWAFWIAKELEALGHTPHIHEWEIKGGDDIYSWMERRVDGADHMLCVVSDAYLKAPYSTLERNAAIWQAAAQALHERALAIREKVLGPDHADTATSLSFLSSLKWAQGDLAAARLLCERALAIREKVL